MTREEREKEIVKAAEKMLDGNPNYMSTRELAFVLGAHWADSHPHWISVEEEMPPIGGIVLVAIPLGGELSVLPLSIKNESDFKYLSGMTHWMRLPQAPKGGE